MPNYGSEHRANALDIMSTQGDFSLKLSIITIIKIISTKGKHIGNYVNVWELQLKLLIIALIRILSVQGKHIENYVNIGKLQLNFNNNYNSENYFNILGKTQNTLEIISTQGNFSLKLIIITIIKIMSAQGKHIGNYVNIGKLHRKLCQPKEFTFKRVLNYLGN